jgi:hypothetical protein
MPEEEGRNGRAGTAFLTELHLSNSNPPIKYSLESLEHPIISTSEELMEKLELTQEHLNLFYNQLEPRRGTLNAAEWKQYQSLQPRIRVYEIANSTLKVLATFGKEILEGINSREDPDEKSLEGIAAAA